MSTLLYKITADKIRSKIALKEWTEKLPSETELCKLFEISRITLRRSIQELCKEGLIIKRHGLGMYVQKDNYDPFQIHANTLFVETLAYRTIQVLRNIKPDTKIAGLLKIKSREAIVEAHRLAYYNNIPVSFLIIRMPEKIYQEGFYENIVRDGLVIPSLKRVGIKLKITRVTMHPFILKDDQPSILMKKGESALFLRRIGFDERDHPILVIEHTMNGAYSDKLLSIQTVH